MGYPESKRGLNLEEMRLHQEKAETPGEHPVNGGDLMDAMRRNPRRGSWVAPEHSAFEAERRAFWREAYLAAASARLIDAGQIDMDKLASLKPGAFVTMKPQPIEFPTPEKIADAALAEFDKRFK